MPVLLAIAVFALVIQTHAAPSNDNFANRIVITGMSNTVTGSNVGATRETGEQKFGFDPGVSTVWWSWTAPTNWWVVIDTIGSSFDTHLTIYTGTAVSNLMGFAGDARSGGYADGHYTSKVAFAGIAGTTYQIAVDEYAGVTGNIILNLQELAPPPNDNFTNRIIITGISNSVTGSNFWATKEPGEPNHAGYVGGASVWWTWTASADATATLDFAGSSFSPLLRAIYTGDAVTNLVLVASSAEFSEDALAFLVKAGTNYQIAVDGAYGNIGSIVLNLQQTPTPPNDNFANRIVITGISNSVNGSNAGATKEPGEPDISFDRGGSSVWWSWTAPTNSLFGIDTIGSSFYPLLEIYTGTSVSNLNSIASDVGFGRPSRVIFSAIARTTYQIAVDGFRGQTGSIILNLQELAPPPNDDFTNRIIITGISNSVNGSNIGATKEAGETNHAGNPGGASVWWTWTAATDETATLATLTTVGSWFQTLLAVYTGDSVTNLTLVASSTSFSTTALVFPAKRGTNYQIAVDGDNGASGIFVLNLGVIYDDFANRLTISGTNITFRTSNIGATREPFEPTNNGAYSIWFTWISPSSGGAEIETTSDPNTFYSPILTVYTGTNLANLTTVAYNSAPFSGNGQPVSKARVVFSAVAGETYQIAVSGSPDFNSRDGGRSALTISLNLSPPPHNDLFSNAVPITGRFYETTGSFIGASQESAEPDHGAQGFGQTLWWTWVTPADLGVSTIPMRLMADAVSFPPGLGVYVGDSVSNLTTVPLLQETNGMTRTATFTATAGTIYHIALAGSENDESTVISLFGNFRFRLNSRALAVSILNLRTNNTDGTVPFTADARVENLGPATSNPLRVYVTAIPGASMRGPFESTVPTNEVPQGVWPSTPVILSPGQSTIVPIAGTVPPPSPVDRGVSSAVGYGIYAELQEQLGAAIWSTVDETLVLFGNWPNFAGTVGPGGGVIRLDPAAIGLATYYELQRVQILGPTQVDERSTTQYLGRATYYGINPKSTNTFDFTNSVWRSSHFLITNGLFTAGSVTSNTLVALSVVYTNDYLYTNRANVMVLNLPPTVALQRLPSSFSLTVQGDPGGRHAIDVAESLSNHVTWVPLVTNFLGSNGLWTFGDSITTNRPRRFYRARQLD